MLKSSLKSIWKILTPKLLHDIGRFKQIKLYDNFIDNMENNDHADYGVKILFEENLIRKFIEDDK